MKAAPNRLRVIRAERRITQKQIEIKTHGKLSQTRVSLIENGYEPPPSDAEKRLLARVLKTPIHEVFPDEAVS